MGVFDKIKSLFIIEEPATEATADATNAGSTNTVVAKDARAGTVVQSEQPVAGGSTSGKVTDKFTDTLMKALADNNIEGFDYLEFRQGLLSLAKMPMDEATRFQAAFSMAQAMGATPMRLVETGNAYLKVLEGELSKFNEAVANQSNAQIGSKQSELKQLKELILQKEQQLQKIGEEIKQHQERTNLLHKELAESTNKVETTKNNFLATYQSISDTIKNDISNIQKYLTNK